MEKSKQKEKIIACVLVAFSLVYCFGCLQLKVGHLSNPGAGLLPWLIGILLLLFTSMNFYTAFKPREAPREADHQGETLPPNYRASLGIAVCVVVYPFLLMNLKFLLTTAIILFTMLLCLKYKKVLGSLLISIAVSVISFLIFSLLLGVSFPGGVLEDLILSLL